MRTIDSTKKNKQSILPILYIDVSQNMCNNNALQRHIARRTNNGELIANFLADTVEGKHHDAKYHHKLEAMKHLIRFGFTDDTNRHSHAGGNPEGQGEGRSHFWGLIPTPEELAAEKNSPSPSMGEGRDGGDESPLPLRGRVREGVSLSSPPSMSESVTHLDILNYDIAHLIRTETADGHTIAEFLSDVMTQRDKSIHPEETPNPPHRPYGSSKRNPAQRLRTLRQKAQACR